jgi:hypothetical protein
VQRTGIFEKPAGKVFHNHTRRRKKEKAPKVDAFFSPFFIAAPDLLQRRIQAAGA